MREEIIRILKTHGFDAEGEVGGCEGIKIQRDGTVVIYPTDWWANIKSPEEAAEIIMKEYSGA